MKHVTLSFAKRLYPLFLLLQRRVGVDLHSLMPTDETATLTLAETQAEQTSSLWVQRRISILSPSFHKGGSGWIYILSCRQMRLPRWRSQWRKLNKHRHS